MKIRTCCIGLAAALVLSFGSYSVLAAPVTANAPAALLQATATNEQEITLSISSTALKVTEAGKRLFDITATVTPGDAVVTFTASGKVTIQSQENLRARVVVTGEGSVLVRATKDGYPAVEKTMMLTNATTKPQPTNASLASEVVKLVNQERAKNDLPALAETTELSSAAQTRAKELAQSFSHTRPDGQKFYSIFGITDNYYYGENIAMGQSTSATVVKHWMASTGHRENILDSTYSAIGVGVYKKGNTLYWVQIFKNDVSLDDADQEDSYSEDAYSEE